MLRYCSPGEKDTKREVITIRGPLKVNSRARYEQAEASATRRTSVKGLGLFFGRILALLVFAAATKEP